jgi:hydrogenase maturation protein HypF
VAIDDAFQPISPDVSTCPDCLRELFDPHDRRYRYPFTNCTNCGPRFTIIKDIPYDRPKTTMADFALCPDCAAEYHDPLNRRFHAQPVACPVCGPQIWLEMSSEGEVRPTGFREDEAMLEVQRMLGDGKIIAIKGLGGFHLACDATNAQAVSELRRRKLRVDKPFALMMPDLATVNAHCFVDAAESELLDSRERPIVILQRRPESPIAEEVAPGQDTLGVMLPYTPLHYLLFAAHPEDKNPDRATALVMTSGNLSEEPIAYDNEEARQRLSSLADAFLMHDRPIRTRCDDSVVRVTNSTVYPMRRSRGYAPFPVLLPWKPPPTLATGAELKNTFCMTRGEYAFLSHHIGDLENYETLQSFEDGVSHYERLFRIKPEIIAYDLHPDYLATRYALQRAESERLPSYGVQHHHAHIAACMVENGLSDEEPVIGLAFDGTGFGEDGRIWGGEFLIADYRGYLRTAHLRYVPLPGGDRAIREPWRIALAWLREAGVDWEADLRPVQHAMHHPGAPALEAIERQLAAGINTPLTSSMGRLFDAAAALAGVRQSVNYEAQAAIEFEALIDEHEYGFYPFAILENSDQAGDQLTTSLVIDPGPLFQAMQKDLCAGVPVPAISARFHNGVAEMTRQVVETLSRRYGLSRVVLSGGVWQNMALLYKTMRLLQNAGMRVFIHAKTPTNDGGIALGQAVIADYRLKAE